MKGYKTKGKIIEKIFELKYTVGLGWVYNPIYNFSENKDKTYTIEDFPLIKAGTKIKFTLEIVE